MMKLARLLTTADRIEESHKMFQVLATVVLVFIGGVFSTLLAAPISGTITISADAPTGGVQFFYMARDISGEGESNQSGFSTIPAGSDSLEYSLPNVPDNPDATWVVSYSCGFTPSCLDYVERGYFKAGVSGTTTFDSEQATPVSQGSSDINMQVPDGTMFSGSLTLPSGVAPAEGVDVIIFIFDGSITRNEDFTIEEGESSVDFRMKMPASDTLDYIVRYSCPTLGQVSSYCFDNFVRNGLYKMGAPGNVVATTAAADQLPAEIPRDDLDMEFLTGSTISGRISLPSGVAPAGGVTVTMSATDTGGGNPNSFRSATIPAKAIFVDYSISVADDDNASWRIAYSCSSSDATNNCDDYFAFGFYDADDVVDTTTDRISDADTLAGGTSHSNINLSLLEELTISGVIRIEDPLIAPAGGLMLSISVQDSNGGGVAVFEEVFIAAGETSTTFSMAIPDAPETNWDLSYFCRTSETQKQCDAYERFGYYDGDAPGTTTNDLNESEALVGGMSHFKKQLTIFARPVVESEPLCFPITGQNGAVSVICL